MVHFHRVYSSSNYETTHLKCRIHIRREYFLTKKKFSNKKQIKVTKIYMFGIVYGVLFVCLFVVNVVFVVFSFVVCNCCCQSTSSLEP